MLFKKTRNAPLDSSLLFPSLSDERWQNFIKEPAMKPNDLKKRLQQILNNDPHSIKAHVIQEALEYGDIKTFFFDLQKNGCTSGMISPLIYYNDTHHFFEDHYDEIEQLREQTEDMLGEPIQIKGDLKNTLAWFAFEETAYQLAIELGLT